MISFNVRVTNITLGVKGGSLDAPMTRENHFCLGKINDVVILMAKIPFTGYSKYPNPLNKNFPWGYNLQTPTMKCGSPQFPHLPLYTVVCMKDMPFDLISSSLLNFPGGLANVNVMFQATRTTQHGNIPLSFTSAKCFFWFIVFFS